MKAKSRMVVEMEKAYIPIIMETFMMVNSWMISESAKEK